MAALPRGDYQERIPFLTKNSEVYTALGVVGILVLMILPVPSLLLDLLISFNITLALIILLVSMYILKPLDLSSFPSILLLATLFRLSLNVASTRIILLHGNEGVSAAGKVIMAFGNFVVGGNYVAGAIVFLILVIINLVVITKGAGRIAEVAARFTLDAMPGKQMSIDADLNAGLIDDDEAKKRRREIASEADFYGAMDGAGKFVKGDAIAGVVITLINIIGGLAIGVLQNGMSFSNAAQTYTLLTVGDGLVSQIPALVISTAAGIVVSSAGSEGSLGKNITTQILMQPKAIGIASAILLGFGLVPGLPSLPFILLSIITGIVAYLVIMGNRTRSVSKEDKDALARKKPASEKLDVLPPLDVLALEVGYGLIPLVDMEQNGELLERIKTIRSQIAQEMGIIIPPVHIQDNMQLKPNEYAILLKGNQVARGDLMIHHHLALNPGIADGNIEGTPTTEPTFGLPAVWIRERNKEKALAKGYTVVDLPTVLITHMSEVIRRHAHELLGRQDVQYLVDTLRQSHPKVVEELIPNLLSLGGLGRVLQNLLKEQIPIRDLLTIMETMADWAGVVKDTDLLTEYARQALARTITKIHENQEGEIPIIAINHEVETTLSEAAKRTEQGTFLSLPPGIIEALVANVSSYAEKFSALNSKPIILCSARNRRSLKELIERFIPAVVVLSYNDLVHNANVRSLGTVVLAHAN